MPSRPPRRGQPMTPRTPPTPRPGTTAGDTDGPGGGLGTCRSCGAAVRWAHTAAGRAMPLNPNPHPNGNVALDDNGRCRVLAARDLPHPGPTYRPHWATCPKADAHRRRRQRHLIPDGRPCDTCDQPMPADLVHREHWTTHPTCDPHPQGPQ